MKRSRWLWLLGLLGGLLGNTPAFAQVVARGLETFPATGIRLVPVGSAPGASLCTSAADGRVAYDGGIVYVCNAGSWVTIGSTSSIANTTAAAFTVNTDANGSADEDAALRLKGQSTFLGAAADAVLTTALGASPPSIAVYWDTTVDQYFVVGPPGDALGTGALEAGIRLRAHGSGDPVGTVKQGALTQRADGVLVLDGAASVQVADALDVQGSLTLTGSLAAASVSVADAGGQLDATDAEAAFSELAGLLIPDTLATAPGQYLRSAAAGTWAARTTAETQGDLDILTTTAAALSTGAASVGADATGHTYASGGTVQAQIGQIDAQLATTTTATTTADSLAESVATDHTYASPVTIHWPGTNQDLTFPAAARDASDHEVYVVATSSVASQAAALEQCWTVPQRAAATGALASALLVYKTTGTATAAIEVLGSDGAQCEAPSYTSSASKASITIADGNLADCATAGGGLVCLRAWCNSGATSGTCSLGRFYPRWDR